MDTRSSIPTQHGEPASAEHNSPWQAGLLDDTPDTYDDREVDLRTIFAHQTSTAYQRRLWALAHDPATFPDRPDLCQAWQAQLTLAPGMTPALSQALDAIAEDLASLDVAAANARITTLLQAMHIDAQNIVARLSPDDARLLLTTELAEGVQALCSHLLTTDELLRVLHDVGEHQYLDARPTVMEALRHPSAGVRRQALHTLLIAWGLPSTRHLAFAFLFDPDPECRWQAMRALNPAGTPCTDLRVLRAYASSAANTTEEPWLRVHAYGELLAACGFPQHHDTWNTTRFLATGGSFSHAPHSDWNLIAFFSASATTQSCFTTTLTYQQDAWADQDGHRVATLQDLTSTLLQPIHHLAHTALSSYRLTITVSPLHEGEDSTPNERSDQ